MSGTRRKLSAVMLALVVSAALVGPLASSAGAKAKPKPMKIDSVETTSPRSGPGTVTKKGKVYEVVVPLFVLNQLHHFVLKYKGSEVDSFEFTVTPTQGDQITATTAEGGTAMCTENHDFQAKTSNATCKVKPAKA